MIGVVLASESEQTQQYITMLIIALVAVGVLLMLLTIWYWRYTNPRRYTRRVLSQPGSNDVDLRYRQASGQGPPVASGHGSAPYGDYGAGAPRHDPSIYDDRYGHSSWGQRILDDDHPGPGRADPYRDPYARAEPGRPTNYQ